MGTKAKTEDIISQKNGVHVEITEEEGGEKKRASLRAKGGVG